SMHLAGVVDEAPADCLAIQLEAYVVRRLGASPAFARAIAREYWRYYYGGEDERYRSVECRSGGSLDVFRTTAWPTPGTYPAGPAARRRTLRRRGGSRRLSPSATRARTPRQPPSFGESRSAHRLSISAKPFQSTFANAEAAHATLQDLDPRDTRRRDTRGSRS